MVKEPNIADIAALSGVSVATVSRYFSGAGRVSEATAERIARICEQEGYSPKKYRHRNSRIYGALVGIIVADLNNVFFLEIIQSITEALHNHNVEVVICNSDESPENEIRSLSVLRKIAAGIIISPVSNSAEYNSQFIESINKEDIPVVLLDRDTKSGNLSGVFQNNYSGSVLAIQTLINNGHRNIGIITGPTTTKPGLERLSGYLDTLRINKLPIVSDYIMYGDFRTESSEALTRQLLSKHSEVTALFCTNNMIAQGAYTAIRQLGMSVPQDIALISYGEISSDFMHSNYITKIKQPTVEIGRECAIILLDLINKKQQKEKRVTFESLLRIRGSEVYPTNRKKTQSPSDT